MLQHMARSRGGSVVHKVLAPACVVAIAGVLVCWQLLVLVLEANSCKHKRAHKPTLALRELANTKVCRCSPAV